MIILKKIALALAAIWAAFLFVSAANAQSTRAQLTTTFLNPCIFANTSGLIVEGCVYSLHASEIASFGTLADNNVWTAINTFTNPASVWNGSPIGTSYGGLYGAASGALAIGAGPSSLPTFITLGTGVQTALQNATNASGGFLTNPAPFTALSGQATLAQLPNLSPYTILLNGTGSSATPTASTTLPSPGQFYANTSTGNDSNDCLAASSSGGHAPCATFEHTLAVALQYASGNQRAQINLAAGQTFTKNGSVTFVGSLTFNGSIQCCTSGIFIDGGGTATIDDSSTSDTATIIVGTGAVLLTQNVHIKHSGASSAASGVFVQDLGGYFPNTGTVYGSVGSSGQMIHGETSSAIEMVGNVSIESGASAGSFFGGSHGSKFIVDGKSITCLGAASFGNGFFFLDTQAGIRLFTGTTFPSCAGNVTGRHYIVNGLGLLDTTGDATILAAIPGNSPGVVQYGGLVSPMPAPTVSACTNLSGAAPNANSNDEDFSLTFTGNNSSCALNWGMGTQPNAPICSSPGSTAGGSIGITPTTSGVTITGSFVNGQSLYVRCKHAPSS